MKLPTTNVLTVTLLRQSSWQELIAKAEKESGKPINAAEPRLAAAILSGLHGRHIGIPPNFAFQLAAVLLRPTLRPENYPPPWNAVARALATARDDLYANRPSDDHRSTDLPLRLDASVPYAVFGIAAPVVELACRHLGRMILFSADVEAAEMTLQDYTEYTKALLKAAETLSEYDQDELMALFWQERALAVMDLTLARPSRTPVKDPFSQVDPQDMGLFQRLRPDLDTEQDRAPELMLVRRPRHWRDRRMRDTGFEGVTITRRPEDIQRRLLSELIYPELIQLDRMLNSGYWVLNPPPKPIEMRDILVVGICPGPATGLSSAPQNSFTRACWFEFVGYLSCLLQQNGLEKTELRWIDGDASGRWRSLALLLHNLPDSAGFNRRFSSYRHVFRLRSGWLPHLLDRRARRYALVTPEQDSILPELTPVAGWASRVWREQRESAGWLPSSMLPASATFGRPAPIAGAFTSTPLDVNRFYFVHIMLMLPEALRPTDEAHLGNGVYAQRNALLRMFDVQKPSCSISITWIPENPLKGEWHFDAHPRVQPRLSLTTGNESGTQVAAQLIHTWIDNLTLEMADG